MTNFLRTLVAFGAALSPIAVLIAGGIALGMSAASADWVRFCSIIILLCIYILIFDGNVRRY